MAKGGAPAVTGLLHGYQQAQIRNQQMAQQQGQQDWQRQFQQAQLNRLTTEDAQQAEDARLRREEAARAREDQASQRRMQALQTIRQIAGNPDLTEEEAFQQMEMLTRQAPAMGLSQVDVEQAAYVAPTRRQKAHITRMLADVDKMYPATEEREKLKLANGMTVGEARQQIAQVSGTAPIAKPPANSVNAGSFEDYVNAPPDRRAQLLKDRKDYMQADDRPRITVNTGGSLAPRVQTAVNGLSRGFDSLPIVKTTQKQAEAVSFADSMDVNTKNPADDQALIYAFAKAMDPESVVREGEYATVQRYAQSWAESFGFNAARIFTNTAFLTPQARANMKKTIRARYLAGKNQYDNVYRATVAKINKVTGGQDGADYVTDYAAGFPGSETAPAPAAPAGTVAPAGASYQDYLKSRGR
jgi:hypothetical protein